MPEPLTLKARARSADLREQSRDMFEEQCSDARRWSAEDVRLERINLHCYCRNLLTQVQSGLQSLLAFLGRAPKRKGCARMHTLPRPKS